jgi:hypothetical protein
MTDEVVASPLSPRDEDEVLVLVLKYLHAKIGRTGGFVSIQIAFPIGSNYVLSELGLNKLLI